MQIKKYGLLEANKVKIGISSKTWDSYYSKATQKNQTKILDMCTFYINFVFQLLHMIRSIDASMISINECSRMI